MIYGFATLRPKIMGFQPKAADPAASTEAIPKRAALWPPEALPLPYPTRSNATMPGTASTLFTQACTPGQRARSNPPSSAAWV